MLASGATGVDSQETAIAAWAVESESDMSDAASEVDLEHEHEVFAIEEEGNVDVRSAFLKDMLSEKAIVSEVAEGQEKSSKSSMKVVGGDIESYLAGW